MSSITSPVAATMNAIAMQSNRVPINMFFTDDENVAIAVMIPLK